MHGQLYSWAAGLSRWLRRMFRGKPRYQRPVILDEFYSDRAALYRIQDASIPGCVEIWKFVHQQSTADLAIIIIDIAQLRQELAEQRTRLVSRDRLAPWQHELAGRLETEIQAQNHVDASHLWIVTWIKQEHRTDKQGRHYSIPAANLVGCWAVDLQGAAGAIAGNRYASHIASFTAKRILNRENSIGWEDYVKAIPWLKWLEAATQKIIHRDHLLQPLKRRFKHEASNPSSYFFR